MSLMESTMLQAKGSMPHITSQWQTGQHGSRGARPSPRRNNKSTEYLRPIAIPPPRPSQRPPKLVSHSHNTSLLGSSENDVWDFGSIRHIRQSSEDDDSHRSMTDSVFEIPYANYGSPISSSSSFIAELEDTSLKVSKPLPYLPLCSVVSPMPSPTKMDFKTTQITSRAVIKVIDETIAAIEETNRELLARAIAAEEAAQILRDQNSALRLKWRQYNDHNRPKRATSSSIRNGHRRHVSTPPISQPTISTNAPPHDPTPLSTFNEKIDKLIPPKTPQLKPVDKPQYRPAHTRSASIPIEPTTQSDLTFPDFSPMSIFNKTLPRVPRKPTAHDEPLPTGSRVSMPTYNARVWVEPKTIPPARKRCPIHPAPKINISTPIPGSVVRHEVTYNGTPLSSTSQRAEIVSLEEARRRAKPLPPPGPMSPSIVSGLVEIGTPKGIDAWGKAVTFEEQMDIWESEDSWRSEKKKRSGFSDLSWWCKRRDGVKAC